MLAGEHLSVVVAVGSRSLQVLKGQLVSRWNQQMIAGYPPVSRSVL
jgi:hypothetical protein